MKPSDFEKGLEKTYNEQITPPLTLREKLKGNWHEIVGANGMCECGSESGICGERLLSFIESEIQAAKEEGWKFYQKRGYEYGAKEEREKILKKIEEQLEIYMHEPALLKLRDDLQATLREEV